MISVDGLTVRVPGFVLDHISFTVPAGSVGVVTGATGAGKTTLLETIAGVRPPSAGRVILDGNDVSQSPPEEREVGLVYQQAWLFPHLAVQQNIAYGARPHGVIANLIPMLQLEPLLEKPVATLSGGERQLVALARALARAPRILLLDEPFAAMDSSLRAAVRRSVLDWAAAHGMTTLLVTHDAGEASLDGGIQLRLERGRLVTPACAAPPP